MSGTKKRTRYVVVLIVVIVIGLLGMSLWQFARGGEKAFLFEALAADELYYKNLQKEFTDKEVKNEEIVSKLKRYEERAVSYIYYSEEEELYYVTLDIYFMDAEQLRDKDVLFLVMDERFYWTTEKASIELWVFDDDRYIQKDDLGFVNAAFRAAEIDIHELENEQFPLHIQVKFTGTWAEKELPEEIIFEYGVW